MEHHPVTYTSFPEPTQETPSIGVPADGPVCQDCAQYTGDTIDLVDIERRCEATVAENHESSSTCETFLADPSSQESSPATNGLQLPARTGMGSPSLRTIREDSTQMSHSPDEAKAPSTAIRNGEDGIKISSGIASPDESPEDNTVADKGKAVAQVQTDADILSATSTRRSLVDMLGKYTIEDLRLVFPDKSDDAIRNALDIQPGTPRPVQPEHIRMYANQAAAAVQNNAFIRGQDTQEDPFTGNPERSNLLFSASGNIPMGMRVARANEDGGGYDEEISDLDDVVAASTPRASVIAAASAASASTEATASIPPPPSRDPPPPPASDAAATAAEMMQKLDRLAADNPEVDRMLREWGYRSGGGGADSRYEPAPAASTASSAATVMPRIMYNSIAVEESEYLHEQDERSRAKRLQRERIRNEKKSLKAVLKMQKSRDGSDGGGGLFGRFRRGGSNSPSGMI
jgi:hypothetical protein